MDCVHYDELEDACLLYDSPSANLSDLCVDSFGHCQCVGSECPDEDCPSYSEEE